MADDRYFVNLWSLAGAYTLARACSAYGVWKAATVLDVFVKKKLNIFCINKELNTSFGWAELSSLRPADSKKSSRCYQLRFKPVHLNARADLMVTIKWDGKLLSVHSEYEYRPVDTLGLLSLHLSLSVSHTHPSIRNESVYVQRILVECSV